MNQKVRVWIFSKNINEHYLWNSKQLPIKLFERAWAGKLNLLFGDVAGKKKKVGKNAKKMKETKTGMYLKTLEVTIHLQEQMTQKFKT